MNKTAQQIMLMGVWELKRYIAGVIGHKVDQIVTKVQAGKEVLIRFRHETYAYSLMQITWSDGEVKHCLLNYETNKYEEITK